MSRGRGPIPRFEQVPAPHVLAACLCIGLGLSLVLREARLSWDKDGDVATPVVGERSDDPDTRLAKRLRALQRANNDRKAR